MKEFLKFIGILTALWAAVFFIIVCIIWVGLWLIHFLPWPK